MSIRIKHEHLHAWQVGDSALTDFTRREKERAAEKHANERDSLWLDDFYLDLVNGDFAPPGQVAQILDAWAAKAQGPAGRE